MVDTMLLHRWSDRDEHLGPAREAPVPSPSVHSEDDYDDSEPLAAVKGIGIAILVSIPIWLLGWLVIRLLT